MIRKPIMTAAVLVLALVSILQAQKVTMDYKEKFFTIKLGAGYNSWLWASSELSSENAVGVNTKGESAGGISASAAFLLGDNQGLQYGIEASYLPIYFLSVNPVSSVSLNEWVFMAPVTADLVWNAGFTYLDAGLGIAYMDEGYSITGQGLSEGTNFIDSAPSLIAKLGVGLIFKFGESFGLDISLTFYYPFSNFGFDTGPSVTSSLNRPQIDFMQINASAGFDIFL